MLVAVEPQPNDGRRCCMFVTLSTIFYHVMDCRRRADGEQSAGVPKFRRGLPVATRRLVDKKLKGRLKHTEALAEEAAASAAKAHQWLLPDAAGSLEAEGLERTWRFGQSDIVQGESSQSHVAQTDSVHDARATA